MATNAEKALLNPEFWLVIGLEWPSQSEAFAESAIAIAPGIVPRQMISAGASVVLDIATEMARNQNKRVVFFSELSDLLRVHGVSWEDLNVDWEAVIEELAKSNFVALFLTLSQFHHFIICTFNVPLDGRQDITEKDRSETRAFIAATLQRDWAPAFRHLLT